MPADSDDDPAAILGSTQFEPGPADYDDDSEDKLWDAIAILDERRGQYLVDWAGVDEHGKPWEPSWTLKSNCTDALIAAWKKKKEAKAGKRKSRNKPESRRSSTTSSKRTLSPTRPKVKEMYVELPMSPAQRKRKALEAPDDAQEPPAKRRATRSSAPASTNGRSSRSSTKLDDEHAQESSKRKRGRPSNDGELEKPNRKRAKLRKDEGDGDDTVNPTGDLDEEEAPPPKAPRAPRKDAKDAPARTITSTKPRRSKDEAEPEDDTKVASSSKAGRTQRKGAKEAPSLTTTTKKSKHANDKVNSDDQAEPVTRSGGSRTREDADARRRTGAKSKRSKDGTEVEVESEDQAEAEPPAPTNTEEPLFLPDFDSDARGRPRPAKKYGGSRTSRQRDRERDGDPEPEPERSPTPKTRQKKSSTAAPKSKSQLKAESVPKSKSKKAVSPELGARSHSPAPPGADEGQEEEDAGDVFNRRSSKSKSKRREETAHETEPAPLPSRAVKSKSKAKKALPSPSPPHAHKVTFDVGEEEGEEEDAGDAFNRHPSKSKSTSKAKANAGRQSTSWHSPGRQADGDVNVDVEQEEEADTWLEDDDVMAGMQDDFVAGAGDEEEEEEEEASEYKPTQTQTTGTQSTHTTRTDIAESPDKPPTQSTNATDESTRSVVGGADDDSYRPTQDGTIISEHSTISSAAVTQNGHGRKRDKARILKPLPYVSPSKFTPLLPPPSSQIEEFTPSPERRRAGDASDNDESEDENERIARRGQELADLHADIRRDKEREKKVAWADVMEAAATIDNINEQTRVVDAEVDSFINWDAAAPADSQEQEQSSSIVEETPLSQQGLLGARAASAPVVGLQEQLRSALELLQKRSQELASTKARLAELEQAPQPQPQPQPEPPATPPPLRLDAAVGTDHSASLADAAVATDAEAVDPARIRLVELEEELKQHKQSVASLRGELDALTSVSRDAIDAASRLGKENAALSASNAILQSQATHGVAQARLLGETAAKELEGEVERWRALAELLQAQAARTDDTVRAKAAKFDILAARVAELEEELGGQRRLVDDMGARYAGARDELEDERQRNRRCTWFLGSSRCGEVFSDKQSLRDHWVNVHAAQDYEPFAPTLDSEFPPST